jgi:hypothetical protein
VELAPAHPPYRSMSAQLRTVLAEHEVPSTGRHYPVDQAVIRARLSKRATEPGSSEGAP